jgi:alpha-mannosidase
MREIADNIDQLEQHQCFPLLHVQLVRNRWNSSTSPHDPSRQLQRSMHLVRHTIHHIDHKLISSGEIVKGVSANKNLEVTDQCLFLFGNGDGGGGPTPLMMEKVSPFSLLCPSFILPRVNV